MQEAEVEVQHCRAEAQTLCFLKVLNEHLHHAYFKALDRPIN